MSTRRTDKRFTVEVSPALYEELNRLIPDRLRRRVVTPLLHGLVKVLQKEDDRQAILGAILANELTAEQLLESELAPKEPCMHPTLTVIAYPTKDGQLWGSFKEYVTMVKGPLAFATVCSVCKRRVNVHMQTETP